MKSLTNIPPELSTFNSRDEFVPSRLSEVLLKIAPGVTVVCMIIALLSVLGGCALHVEGNPTPSSAHYEFSQMKPWLMSASAIEILSGISLVITSVRLCRLSEKVSKGSGFLANAVTFLYFIELYLIGGGLITLLLLL